MQIKRSVTRFFAALVLPAISIAVVAYFGSYAIWGERGLLALEDTQARLGIQQEQLAQVTDERSRLEHRIQLMEPGHADPDLVEELARGQLMDGAPNQVAVPRTGALTPPPAARPSSRRSLLSQFRNKALRFARRSSPRRPVSEQCSAVCSAIK